MRVQIKLYGHLVCLNEQLESFKMNRFSLDVPEGTALAEIHKLIFGDFLEELVSIVDGHAQRPDYVLGHSCNISIFRPMGGRSHDPFERVK